MEDDIVYTVTLDDQEMVAKMLQEYDLIASFRAPGVITVVAFTMILVVVFGSLIGMSLPFILSRFNMDPQQQAVRSLRRWRILRAY